MLYINNENEKLFAKSVPITIKDGYNQSRSSNLHLTVEWQESAAFHTRELLIKLTDSNDPFFLYDLHLSESDFQMLKNNYGLLVDFPSFPNHFIELIEHCIGEANKSKPKVSLVLHLGEKIGNVASTSQLDLVVTDQFQSIAKFSLKFVAATESTVKEYLAVCFRNLKEEKHNLENQLCILEKDFKNKLSVCQDALEKKCQELELVKKELNVDINMVESKLSRELQSEREKFLARHKDSESKFEREKQEMEQNFKREIQQLESKISYLDSSNKEYKDQNRKQEDKIKELRNRCHSTDDELKRTKESLREFREKNESLSRNLKDIQMQVAHQKNKISELEEEVTFAKDKARQMEERLESYPEEMKNLEDELRRLRESIIQEQQINSQFDKDFKKAKYIIAKLQDDNHIALKKVKTFEKSITKNQHDLQEKDQTIDVLKKDLKETKIECKNLTSQIKNSTEQLSCFKQKITLLEEELKAKEFVVNYLKRQLADNCLIPQYNPSSDPPTMEAPKSNAGGDSKIKKANTATTINVQKSKSIFTRKSFPTYDNDTRSTQKSQTPDSAYLSSALSNIKNSDVNLENANDHQTLEIDSDVLSAAFGTDKIDKHSTAKKQTYLRSSRSTKKF